MDKARNRSTKALYYDEIRNGISSKKAVNSSLSTTSKTFQAIACLPSFYFNKDFLPILAVLLHYLFVNLHFRQEIYNQ